MPWHVAPVLRAIEEVRESSGIYITLDSLGVTERKALEVTGVQKVVPVAYTFIYNGQTYTAH